MSGGATKAVTQTIAMPAPTKGNDRILARAVDWNLSKSPLSEDIVQGALSDCPIGAILAALANTPTGKTRINNLITEYKGAPVKTTFSKDVLDDLNSRLNDPDDRRPEKEFLSQRYFSVNLASSVIVSDVFYIKYTDGPDVDMFFMGSSKKALWPCVIEKAFATKIGGYDDLDDDKKYTANYFWKILGPASE